MCITILVMKQAVSSGADVNTAESAWNFKCACACGLATDHANKIC